MAEKAVKTEPKGEWLSKMQIAKRCKLDRQTTTNRLEELGYEPDEERSTSNNHIYWFDDEMEFAVKSAKDTVSAMKIRQLRADAQLKELKLAEARKDLVPITDAIERFQAVIKAMYQEFAIQQPKRLGSRLAKSKTTQEAVSLIKLDTEKIFGRLREHDRELVP